MRRIASILALILVLVTIPASHAADTSEIDLVSTSSAGDLPRTFSSCVLAGGQVRNDGSGIRCRLVETYDFRVYYTATTACDEEVQLEHWGETRGGVITYLFEPHRTTVLPEDTRELDDVGIGTPIPCLDR